MNNTCSCSQEISTMFVKLALDRIVKDSTLKIRRYGLDLTAFEDDR